MELGNSPWTPWRRKIRSWLFKKFRFKISVGGNITSPGTGRFSKTVSDLKQRSTGIKKESRMKRICKVPELFSQHYKNSLWLQLMKTRKVSAGNHFVKVNCGNVLGRVKIGTTMLYRQWKWTSASPLRRWMWLKSVLMIFNMLLECADLESFINILHWVNSNSFKFVHHSC
jgi:hypothetical protein